MAFSKLKKLFSSPLRSGQSIFHRTMGRNFVERERLNSESVNGRINSLRDRRVTRTGSADGFGILGFATGFIGGGVGFPRSLSNNPTVVLGAMLLGMAAGARAGYKISQREIKFATNNVGAALGEEYQSHKNGQLDALLERHKYVFIDARGNIVGTNTDRVLGVGRLRLETIKIKRGFYLRDPRERGLGNETIYADEALTGKRTKIMHKYLLAANEHYGKNVPRQLQDAMKNAFATEALTNSNLRYFLMKNKYFTVGEYGELNPARTNFNRFGIGIDRFNCAEILKTTTKKMQGLEKSNSR